MSVKQLITSENPAEITVNNDGITINDTVKICTNNRSIACVYYDYNNVISDVNKYGSLPKISRRIVDHFITQFMKEDIKIIVDHELNDTNGLNVSYVPIPTEHVIYALRKYLFNAKTMFNIRLLLIAPVYPDNRRIDLDSLHLSSNDIVFTLNEYEQLIAVLKAKIIATSIALRERSSSDDFNDVTDRRKLYDFIAEFINDHLFILSEIAFDKIFDLSFVPSLLFTDYHKHIVIIDKNNELLVNHMIYGDIDLSNCYNDLSDSQLYSKLVNVLNKSTLSTEFETVIVVNGVDDADYITSFTRVSDTDKRRSLTVTYISTQSFESACIEYMHACNKTTSDNYSNDVIDMLLRVHDHQYGDDELSDSDVAKVKKQFNDIGNRVMIRRKELDVITDQPTGVFITECDGIVRRFI